ncbi:MAG: ATP-binding protein [Candidatus Limnocylindrales bacterium]
MQLLERGPFFARLEAHLSRAAQRGEVVLLAGEAGIGKTSLVEQFAAQHRRDTRQLWGACDAQFTPRALGPLLEIASQTGGITAKFARLLSSSVLPYAIRLPDGWAAAAEADSYERADGRITLTVGTGEPEPGETVDDRVRANREGEFADCVTDPSTDRPITIGGEDGILWTFACGGEVGLAANTIHKGLGYRLTLRAREVSADALEALMADLLAGFTFSD